MKKFKKLVAVMLAAIMVMAMGTSVFAAGTALGSAGAEFKFSNTSGSTNHKYTVYQIFSATADGSTLYDIEWGSSINTSYIQALCKALAGDNTIIDGGSTTFGSLFDDVYDSTNVASDVNTYAQKIASILTNYSDNDIVARTFAAIVAGNSGDWLSTAVGTSTYGSSGYTDVDVDDYGYYLITDAYADGNASTENDAISRYMLAVVDGTATADTDGDSRVEVTINTKEEVPSLTKDITTTDSSGTTTADYNTATVGDVISYLLTTKVPDMTDYTSYTYIVTDTLSKGLEFDLTGSSSPITINVYTTNNTDGRLVSTPTTYVEDGTTYYLLYTLTGTDKTTYDAAAAVVGYTEIYDFYYSTSGDSSDDDGTTITITFTSTLLSKWQAGTANTGDIIKISYSAELTSDAVSGTTANTNTAKLTYSSNPTGGGMSTTAEEQNTTYTTQISIDKIDGTDTTTKLKGATFVIYEKTSETYDHTRTVNYSDSEYNDYYIYVDGVMYAVSDGFAITALGLNNQDTYYLYKMVESAGTTSSSGTYQKAVLSDLGAGSYVLIESVTPSGYNTIDPIEITITADPISTSSVTWSVAYTSGAGDGTLTASNGVFTMTVYNYKGSTIPTTGGMGTTILYIIGGILVIGAAVILVTRRRMANK